MARKKSPGKTANANAKAGPKIADSRRAARRRLLTELAGRRLEDVYLERPDIRGDLEAEADAGGDDAWIDRETLRELESLIATRHRRAPVGSAAAGGSASALSGDGALGARILRELGELATPPDPPPPEAAAAPRAAGPAVDLYLPASLFFSSDAVVLVPGFMGSLLSDTVPRGRGLIWIDPLVHVRDDELGALELAPYDGLERDKDPKVRIAATGALPIQFDLLRLALEVRRYTVSIFPVDWRKDLEIAAGALAARLRALHREGWPVHLVAHSQGGLVARRAVQLLGRAEARRIVKHLVLIGPANFGSFSAAFALAGNHGMLGWMRRLGVEPKAGFQRVLATMSGVYQLLPSDPARVPWLAANNYSQPSFWKPAIDAARLGAFYGWARAIDSSAIHDRTTVILGDNAGQPTTGGLVYKGSILQDDPAFNLAGDGTVPHSCSVLDGTTTYLAAGAEHMRLPTYPRVVAAVREILADRTPALAKVSSNPADHLSPLVGPSVGMAAPAVRSAPEISRRDATNAKNTKKRKVDS